jgi:hypothetical protein
MVFYEDERRMSWDLILNIKCLITKSLSKGSSFWLNREDEKKKSK